MYVSSSTYGSSSFLPYEWTVRDNYVTSQHGDHFGSKIFVPNPKCSLFILYGLKQLINEPTRVTKFSSTLIDLIYTNYTDRVGCSEVSNIAISDHSVVYVYRRLSSDLPYFPSLTEIFEILIVKNFEWNVSERLVVRWTEDPNLLWSDWKPKFLRVFNSHAPFRTRRAKLNKTPWINSALKKGVRCC